MTERVEIEQLARAQNYADYKQLLSRVATFTHLIFYNRKLVNIYGVAANGFKMHISRDGHEEAKCIECGHSFLLDPIVEEEAMELKENFNLVLHDHEETCKFYYRAKGKSPIAINKQTVGDYGIVLFREILDHNVIKQGNFYGLSTSIENIRGIEAKHEEMIRKLTKREKIQYKIYVISLLGWRSIGNFNLQCHYCGQTVSLQQFEVWESHRSFCILMQERYWETILGRLMAIKLEQKEGEFYRTEVQVAANKLRQELEKISKDSLKRINQFRSGVKRIQNEIEAIEVHELKEKPSEQRQSSSGMSRLRRLDQYAEELQKFIRNGIKRVKID